MNKVDIKMAQDGPIVEAQNYFEAKADSVVTVGTAIDGEDILTLVFLNNYPVVQSEDGVLTVSGIEKRRIASVTLGMNQAKKFYDSLKTIFEPE